jgi:uncharacterized protein with HEPN domain
MGNYLIHAYFGIDPDVVIGVVRENLSGLEAAIQTYLQKTDDVDP